MATSTKDAPRRHGSAGLTPNNILRSQAHEKREAQADADADNHKQHALAQDVEENFRARSSKRHAHADLALPAFDEVGE